MLVQQYPSLFKGIGKLEGEQVKLHIDKQVTPVAQRARRIPFHLRKEVEKELDHLEQNGIIEKVEGPTPWVSPLVIVPKKNGKVRLCVDMRMPNKAIKRECHPSPTVDDLIHKLNGGTVFSKLDLRSGYHQLALHPESRYITTFATHKGLRRYARLNFGTSSASEIFQNIINELIRDIPGALNISDDVVVFGKTQADHNRALHAVCQKFSEANLTLNQEKCEFNKSSITFFGFVFLSKGISPDPTKVEAINTAKPPTSVSGIRSFLGGSLADTEHEHGFLTFLRLVGCAYFRISKHKAVFLPSFLTPMTLFNSHFVRAEAHHSAWLDAIREKIWLWIRYEEEMLPSYDALQRHWKRSCWVASEWKLFVSQKSELC